LAFSELVVARQPIFDLAQRIIGYELLHRPVSPGGPRLDGEQMTTDVLLSALAIGIDHLVGDKVMFCNAELGVLTGKTPLTLPPERTVIEVIETVEITDEVVVGCERLVEEGYRLALDDFVWVDAAPRLLKLASIVKIDMRITPRKEIPALLKRCRSYGVQMLAEKVESRQELKRCRQLGFELFQGYELERPQLVRGRMIAPSEIARMQLAVSLLTDDLDIHQLEQVLRREPGLVLQLLHLAAVGNDRGMRRRVRTVREALVLLGTRRVRQWIALLLLKAHESVSPDGLATALVRARMCEVLAEEGDESASEFAFAAGLLSSFDLLLGTTGKKLSGKLDIDPELLAAAFHHDTKVGALVGDVIEYERAVSEGRPPHVANAGTFDNAAAIAFNWAMPHVHAVTMA
jgi:EAL and modified HD-GYP domain-containing signal transduction protein